jgi:hypothetical protein
MHKVSLFTVRRMSLSPTTKLDRLYRFHRHDEMSGPVAWNVAAGSLEKRHRLYRIYYKCTRTLLEIKDEITIDVKRPEALQAFFSLLVDLLRKTDLDPHFQHACLDLLVEDPWLSRFMGGGVAVEDADAVADGDVVKVKKTARSKIATE